MLSEAKAVYSATKKKNDFLFNTYVMRPIAAAFVGPIGRMGFSPNQVTLVGLFVSLLGAALLVVFPSYSGVLLAILVLEIGYMLDCVDGMLARYKGIASKQGHLFDFFTDEIKALALLACLGAHLWRAGVDLPGLQLAPGSDAILHISLAGAFILASATSLTNFVRRPEMSGRETTVEAYKEHAEKSKPTSPLGKVVAAIMTFLSFFGHYPSHIYVWALLGRLDLYFLLYIAFNGLYLAKGWAGLLIRFGRS
ncbi:MAG: CDP-alcohol phosphatidyltransferase family protein [Myxococcales bacterium]|nr:CDP-alcohol phosphatidyltransferase family protein [Myxococcales bacterium]